MFSGRYNYHNGARRRLRLHEKGGKEHDMPVHHLLERILDEYIVVAGLQSGQPLFQSVNSVGTAGTGRALNRYYPIGPLGGEELEAGRKGRPWLFFSTISAFEREKGGAGK